jgi:hypothetical protein
MVWLAAHRPSGATYQPVTMMLRYTKRTDEATHVLVVVVMGLN